MLAFEHSRRQQPFGYSYGMESAFHDPYLSQNLNTCASFDSTSSFASLPFSFYDSNPLSAEAPPDATNLAMFASRSNGAFNASSPPSELPPPTLSNASAASVPSNTPSTVSSPYSSHAQACSSQESWSTSNQELGLGPRIISNEGYDPGFGGVDLDSEMAFSMPSKVAEDFVGECNKLPLSRDRPSKPAFLEQTRSFQLSPFPITVKGSSARDCVKVDSVLAQAKSAIPPSCFQSPGTGSPFTARPTTPREDLHASSQQPEAISHSPSNPAACISRVPNFSSPSFSSAMSALAGASPSGKPPIKMSSFDTTAETSPPTDASRFQSHFFAQSSGNYVPPIESSCSFFPAVDSLYMPCCLCKIMFPLLMPTLPYLSLTIMLEQIPH
jgi:hypothetical protein